MIVKYTEFEFSVDGGTVLYAKEWQPATKSRGVICLIHGLGEHSGRYVNMAQYLTQAGYVLLAYDQRGHGKSLGRRGYTPFYDTLLDDIDRFRRESIKRFPGLPTFLYGHSLGGNLVLNYVLRRRPEFAGVIVTSPWLKLTVEPPRLLIALLRLLNRLWPTFSLPSGLDLKALSRDLNVVDAYKADPLVHNRISIRLFVTMDHAGRWALKNAAKFDLPLLLMHGEADRITSSEASKQFAGQVPMDCTLKLWQGLYHELHNEPEKDEVLAYIVKWLEKYS
ncbi:MAG TPA: lysophospholipase [Desulfosporosinus sp.]|nr:lysophospholipase [Desulfosporosinus sp.]